MSDAFDIQRVPPGLQNVLSLVGGASPVALEQRVRGTLDLLQMYGLQQRQVLTAANAAIAENANLDVALGGAWCIVFAASFVVTKTATMTALRGTIAIQRGQSGPFIAVRSEALGPFGATETGSATVCWAPPYPLLCPPMSTMRCVVDILGTDATAAVLGSVELGVVG